MSQKLCSKCGEKPRYKGKHGNSVGITMCEDCQKEHWNTYQRKEGSERKSRRIQVVNGNVTCNTCGQTYPFTEQYFVYRADQQRLRGTCINCKNEQSRVAMAKRRGGSGERQRPPTRKAAASVLKVLIVDPQTHEMTAAVMPILTQGVTRERTSAKLIDFYRARGYVIAEVTPHIERRQAIRAQITTLGGHSDDD